MFFSNPPALLVTLLAALGATSAFAQTAAPAPAPAPAPVAIASENTLSYNIGVVTDYRARNISQSRLKPAVQGGIDFSHKSGAYVGAWASTIEWVRDAGGQSDLELDIYGGYKGTVGVVSYDVGVLNYRYPSASLPINPNTTEIYVAGSIGQFTLKYAHSLTNAFGLANSKNSGYLDLSATFNVGSGFSVVPHVGHQRIAGAVNGIYSYTDYSLTLGKDLGKGLALSASVVGTDADKANYFTPTGKFTGKAGVVMGLKYSF